MTHGHLDKIADQIKAKEFVFEGMKPLLAHLCRVVKDPGFVIESPGGLYPYKGDRVLWALVFEMQKSQFEWTSTIVKVHQLPVVKHLHISGIDTAQLERRMGMINWNKNYREAHNPEAWKVEEEMALLLKSGDPMAAKIVDSLVAKFWIGSEHGRKNLGEEYVNRVISLKTIRFDRSLLDPSLSQAYNLAFHRPVRVRIAQSDNTLTHRWIGASEKTALQDGAFHLVTCPDFELAPLLNALPFVELKEEGLHRSIKGLQNGDSLEIRYNRETEPLLLSLDIKTQALQLHNVYGEQLSLDQHARHYVPPGLQTRLPENGRGKKWPDPGKHSRKRRGRGP